MKNTATLIGYKKCSTCKNIETILKDKDIDYTYREIDKDSPSVEEIKAWHEVTELPLKKFFNTSGLVYKEKGLAKTLQNYTIDEQYELLASDGMLVKRPILLVNEQVYVGPQVKKYLENI
ncbi:arsenate reductase family protein [Actinomyces sp. zg-332]|uniref:ArsC/Spx/MgsR family protein n=1 Tax=Actinomyces sp. zg-332 TaxID=2708340 RepID=UPI00141F22E8|nr:ArsC/Spx/MgsR family protein [Actinomyces sp. zg-332]QPK94140.1 arsenate reductase family protein [Actinomyces sp. zg-332]